MGNCCDGDYDGEGDHLIQSAPRTSQPIDTLRYVLENRGGLRWWEAAHSRSLEGQHIIDNVLTILDSPEPQERLRQALLEFLHQQVAYPAGLSYFASLQPNNRLGSRLNRLRVLLKEANEELPSGEKVLERVGYKSVAFEKISAGWPIQYTLVVDKSGSMCQVEHGHSRYDDAKIGAEHLAEKIERVHRGLGMNMFLFSNPGKFPRFGNLQTCESVRNAFRNFSPDGSTDLAGVLHAVISEHFASDERRAQREHVIIFTDGAPDNKDAVIGTLVLGINRLRDENEMGFTFMQVGCSHEAAEFLHELQDCLTEKGARFNVVDCITHLQYHGMSLSQVIDRYLIQT